MTGRPPKVTLPVAQAYNGQPDVFAVNPTTPTTWNLFWGTAGYWVPVALNRSKAYRAAIRRLGR